DLVFDLAKRDGFEAGIIGNIRPGEGQFDLLLLRKVHHGRYRCVGDVRQCLVGLLGEIEQSVSDGHDRDDVDRDAEGFAAAKPSASRSTSSRSWPSLTDCSISPRRPTRHCRTSPTQRYRPW